MFAKRQLTLTDYWLMVQRRIWLLILPFVAVGLGTAVWCWWLPNIYRASTTILVEAQKVPEGYVRSTVSSPVQERLRTLTQQIKSHTRLEQVMRELRLLEDWHDKDVVDRYINTMRRNIELEVRANEAFTVSYADQDPHVAMQVTNQLASLFITENLKVREQQVVGTTEFLAQELERVRTLLESQEKAVSEYTQRYTEELSGGVNQQTLERLQGQLQTNADAIAQVRFQKSSLMQRLAALEQDNVRNDALDSVFDSGVSHTPSGTTGPLQDPLERQLAQRHEALIELQSRFSDQYPDVKRLKQEIADLEAQLAAKPAAQPAEPAVVQRRPSPEAVLADLRRRDLQAERLRLQKDIHEQRRQVEFQEQRLQRDQERIQQRIADYEHKLANAALRQQELQVLSRDYESTKQNYASLLGGHMQAKVAENLEKRQKAEQFKILDPALLPVQPWKPDRRKIFLMGLVLGLGVGCGAVVLAEYLDRSFHDPEDLKQSTGLPVLVMIPLLPSAEERSIPQRKQRFLPGTPVGRWRI